MKVSRKKINNILIYYGGTVILILIFFYCFYKKYENFYSKPKGMGVKVVFVDPTKMTTKNRLSEPNQVAVCPNGQYSDPTKANSSLAQQATAVNQYGLVNTNRRTVSVNNMNDELFKGSISLFTIDELFNEYKNIIIHLSDKKQNIIWEKIVPDWPKDDINDNNFKKYISNFDIKKLYILPKNIMDNLLESKQNIIFSKIIPTWSDDTIKKLKTEDYNFLSNFMTDNQKKIQRNSSVK